MTDELVHLWPDLANVLSPCGINIFTTPYTYGSEERDEVTCPECLGAHRLELFELRPARSREEQITEVEALRDRLVKVLAEDAALLADANALIARLRGENASRVPAVGVEPVWMGDAPWTA